MEKLITDIQRDLKSFKPFWLQLSKKVCSEMPLGNPDNCSALSGSHTSEVMSYRDRNNLDIVNRQTGILRAVSHNLKNAYNGFDVDHAHNRKFSLFSTHFQSNLLSFASENSENGWQ